MKITIYELLGLIKDGKVPKKIKKTDSNIIYFYNKEHYSLENIYQTEDEYEWLNKENFNLNEEIEIIEEVEDKEYEDIEEYLYVPQEFFRDGSKDNKNSCEYKINQLIRNQKKIIEQLRGEK